MTVQIKIMPLGGVGETGSLNCMLYETENDAVLVDCGVMFPNDFYPGVGIITPDFSILEDVRHKLRALVLTHGHEDHIGATPYFLKRFHLPVYATPFTLGILRQKLAEHHIGEDVLNRINHSESFSIGDFHISTVFANHSIPDTVGLVIQAAGQRVVHLTDFKIDPHSLNGVTDLKRLKDFGDQGVDLLLMDSTNVFASGWTSSETHVGQNLIGKFGQIRGRIVVCLFASNTFRLQSLIHAARATGRKVAITGRSTKEYIAVARSLEILDTEGVEIFDVEEIHQFADSEVMVVVTGSQAEGRSVLNRMSHEMFRPFRLRQGDTLIMSSKMIPGHEGKILSMLNRISLLGVEIIADRQEPPLHASGHACEDELREIFKTVRPKHFIPIHGEHRMFKRHIELAVTEGVAENNTLLLLDGQVAAISSSGLKLVDQKDVQRAYWTESFQKMEYDAIQSRRYLAQNGVVAVAVKYDLDKWKLFPGASVRSEGLVGEELEKVVSIEVAQRLDELIERSPQKNPEDVEQFVRSVVRQFYSERFGLKPEVLVVMV